MQTDQFQFLCLRHLPGRFTVQEAAWYLGFPADDIPTLIKARLLKPTGDPGPKATKIFAYADLRPLHESKPWMHKASSRLYQKNRDRHLKDKRRPKRTS